MQQQFEHQVRIGKVAMRLDQHVDRPAVQLRVVSERIQAGGDVPEHFVPRGRLASGRENVAEHAHESCPQPAGQIDIQFADREFLFALGLFEVIEAHRRRQPANLNSVCHQLAYVRIQELLAELGTRQEISLALDQADFEAVVAEASGKVKNLRPRR